MTNDLLVSRNIRSFYKKSYNKRHAILKEIQEYLFDVTLKNRIELFRKNMLSFVFATQRKLFQVEFVFKSNKQNNNKEWVLVLASYVIHLM